MNIKRYLWAVGALIVLLALLVVDTLAVPKKWRQVEIGEERAAVVERLGRPRIAGWDVKGDEWTKRTGIGCVAMRVTYRVVGDHVTVRGVRWSHWIGCRDFHFRLKKDESL
jgi:hypothetical protein